MHLLDFNTSGLSIWQRYVFLASCQNNMPLFVKKFLHEGVKPSDMLAIHKRMMNR